MRQARRRPRSVTGPGRVFLLVATLALALTGCRGGESWQDACRASAEGFIECDPDDRPPAPELGGELLAGGRYDLTQDRGQVVVVNFWGSWCNPCRAEADDLEGTYQATRDRGVRFLGINIQDGRDKARAFEEGRVSYPSIFDPASRLALDFDVPPTTIPATVVLDRQGRIAVVIRKAVQRDTFEPVVARIAAEAPPPAPAASDAPPASDGPPASDASPASDGPPASDASPASDGPD